MSPIKSFYLNQLESRMVQSKSSQIAAHLLVPDPLAWSHITHVTHHPPVATYHIIIQCWRPSPCDSSSHADAQRRREFCYLNCLTHPHLFRRHPIYLLQTSLSDPLSAPGIFIFPLDNLKFKSINRVIIILFKIDFSINLRYI